MKNYIRSIVSYVLIAAMTALAIPLASRPTNALASTPKQQDKQNELKIKQGSEVAARVKKLKEKNKQVRDALNAFERKGHLPKIDEAWSVSGTLSSSKATHIQSCKSCGVMQRAGLRPQDTVSGDGVEAIFVPTLITATDWQGTVIAISYDEYGNFVNQYVSDVAFINTQNYDTYPWQAAYEVSFDSAGAWLESDSSLGMSTESYFDWGTPVREQPNLQNDQFQVSRLDGATFKHIGLQQTRGELFYPRKPQGTPLPRATRYARCISLSFAAGSASCWITGPFTFQCIGGRTAGGAIMCLGIFLW